MALLVVNVLVLPVVGCTSIGDEFSKRNGDAIKEN